ncbi:hypothetical protein HY029_01225 [Candidatus Gottesmanbacteria bacterium]|nr:hypothetical protein [Candidatus Gottesmanbacteria bacterium]
MATSSHRLKIEEKKVFRKLITTFIIFIVSIFILIYAGIPLLTKTIIFFTSFRKENITINTTDNMILNPPILNPLWDATNSGTIVVSGTADKESTVKITINNVEMSKVLVDKDAKFEAKNIKLQEGTNNIVATTLIQDKESSPSVPLVIIYKKIPPKLDISAPSDGQKFLSESKDITISGETDPGNKVTINDRFAIVDQGGKFNYKISLNSGENNFKVVATDIAGNQTIIERKVIYNP